MIYKYNALENKFEEYRQELYTNNFDIEITLHEGNNRILIKACNESLEKYSIAGGITYFSIEKTVMIK